MDEKPKKCTWLVILSMFLSLIIVVLLLYIAYEKEYIQIPWMSETNTSTEQPSEENADDTDAVATTTAFTGTTVTADLPTGWTMQEYYNGQGTDYLSEGPAYAGLTAIKIFDTSDTELFHLEGVNGIGFAGCSDYYAFADDNPAFRALAEDSAEEMGDTMNVVNFSNMPYSEFEWLGTTTRRVATKIFLDSEEGNNYFEASCFNALVTLEGLYFEDGDYVHEGYFYGFNSSLTGAELIQMDSVLESMSLVE